MADSGAGYRLTLALEHETPEPLDELWLALGINVEAALQDLARTRKAAS